MQHHGNNWLKSVGENTLNIVQILPLGFNKNSKDYCYYHSLLKKKQCLEHFQPLRLTI